LKLLLNLQKLNLDNKRPEGRPTSRTTITDESLKLLLNLQKLNLNNKRPKGRPASRTTITDEMIATLKQRGVDVYKKLNL
jgi:hypothetical protein